MPYVCPNCGADVPRGAKACPECGSDDQTGWSEDARTQNLGLPDTEFDYDDFVQREFSKRAPLPRGVSFWWWIVAIVVLTAFVLALIR